MENILKYIWKYQLAILDSQEIHMPQNSELLYVAEQNGILCLWARVAPIEEIVARIIHIRGTGHAVDDELHIGTVLSFNGLVWHVFDVGEKKI